MLTRNIQDLKRSLLEVIGKWTEEAAEMDGWSELGYVGDLQTELMTEAAFNVLLTIQDVNKYYEANFDLSA